MKKMLKLMLTASVSTAVMFASCSEGDFLPPSTPPATEDTPVQVELKLKSEKMDTRAIDENAINDINIYFFSNNINYHFYYPEYAPPLVRIPNPPWNLYPLRCDECPQGYGWNDRIRTYTI